MLSYHCMHHSTTNVMIPMCYSGTNLAITLGFVIQRYVCYPNVDDHMVFPLQTWKCYDQGCLEKAIDSSMVDDVDVDEACRFLKVGLLCTQDISKRRPTMSMVISMLTGEMEVDKEKISKPDVIRDFRDLKLRSKATSSSSLLTSIMARSTPSSSQETTRTSITVTAISDRD
jgi:hypothetical protein